MAYFANGTEGEMYFDRYCARCIHRDGPDGDSGCAVWLAHLIGNYDQCNKPDSVLNLLIPRSKNGLGNEQCLMFVEGRPNEPAEYVGSEPLNIDRSRPSTEAAANA